MNIITIESEYETEPPPEGRVIEYDVIDSPLILVAFINEDGSQQFMAFPASIAGSVAAAIMGVANELL